MTKVSTEERLWELNAELEQQIVERTAEIVGIEPGAELAEAQRRASVGFVANAAHELRTPLAAIVSGVEVLEAGAKELDGTPALSSEPGTRTTADIELRAATLVSVP